MQTVFLTFFGSWVTSEVSFFFEDCSVCFCISDAEGSGDAVTDCAGLTGVAAALDVDEDVKLVRRACGNERLVDDLAHCVEREVVLKSALVDGDVAIARDETNSCDCSFSSACSEILNFLNFLCSHNSPQSVEFEFDRALCLVVMFTADVNAEFLEHLFAERVFRQHTLDCLVDSKIRFFGHQFLVLDLFESADKSCVIAIVFVLEFLARETNLLAVDYNDVVTTVDVGSVFRLVLALEDRCNL